MRQKLASVELGLPSLSLMRRNGFSPVRINLCGSATLIFSPPCSNHEAGTARAVRHSSRLQAKPSSLCGAARLIFSSPCSNRPLVQIAKAEPRAQSGVPVGCRQSLSGGREWATFFVVVLPSLWRDLSGGTLQRLMLFRASPQRRES